MSLDQAERVIRTVLGDIPAAQAGHVQVHEHILKRKPDHVFHRDVPASQHQPLDVEITLANRQWVRRNKTVVRDMMSEADVVEALTAYKAWGGTTMVDSSSIGFGRDPVGLARVARVTGVNIVMGAGHYLHYYQSPSVAEQSEDELADEIVRDIVEGVGHTGVRAGIIGEVGLSWPVHPLEERCLRAAARAQAQTGAALQVHPGRHADAPLQAMKMVADAGGVPERTIMSHVERTLATVDEMIELGRTGCYLAFDLFGQESGYYEHDLSVSFMPNDAGRITSLLALTEAGFAEKLLISQDVGHRARLQAYGGEGYHHILEMAVPAMRARGLDVDLICRRNPADILALR